ncbi:MAG: M28 family peptidase [Prevotella sp.]
MRYIIFYLFATLLLSCGNSKTATNVNDEAAVAVGPEFSADSAYAYCKAQCDFGPRTMNSEAHERCGEWIVAKFRQFGLAVVEQKATLKGYDGTPLKATNIIASYTPKQSTEGLPRILVCAHWDSRPWADNDPDSANWRKPVVAANDGASGVAVILELARLVSQADSLAVGIDFVCFDAEDWGVPQWSDANDSGDSWALGAQHWAANPHVKDYSARFGVLLDMVGGSGAKFFREGMSLHYAPEIVEKVWNAARVVGYSSLFPNSQGGMVTDDHIPVNDKLGIPTIDVIPYYELCPQSSFGPTWHTVGDTLENIDPNTLKAVGQTMVQVLFSEK